MVHCPSRGAGRRPRSRRAEDTSVGSLAGKLTRFAEAGIDEAFVDAFAAFPGLDQTLDFAGELIARTSAL